MDPYFEFQGINDVDEFGQQVCIDRQGKRYSLIWPCDGPKFVQSHETARLFPISALSLRPMSEEDFQGWQKRNAKV